MVVQEIGGKREEQERRQTDDLSTGSESHLVDGASRKEGRQRKKSNTSHGNGKPGNRKREGEIWNGHRNNKDWNETIKISKGENRAESRETGRIKIGKIKHLGYWKRKREIGETVKGILEFNNG